jgi:hypothetical protein
VLLGWDCGGLKVGRLAIVFLDVSEQEFLLLIDGFIASLYPSVFWAAC